MDEMTLELEELVVCASLDADDRDCVEQALDDGYLSLSPEKKSRIRRLLNQRAACPGLSVMQRYRMRRQSAESFSREGVRRRAQAAGVSIRH